MYGAWWFIASCASENVQNFHSVFFSSSSSSSQCVSLSSHLSYTDDDSYYTLMLGSIGCLCATAELFGSDGASTDLITCTWQQLSVRSPLKVRVQVESSMSLKQFGSCLNAYLTCVQASSDMDGTKERKEPLDHHERTVLRGLFLASWEQILCIYCTSRGTWTGRFLQGHQKK